MRNFLFVGNWPANVEPLIKAGSLSPFGNVGNDLHPPSQDVKSFLTRTCGGEVMVLIKNPQGYVTLKEVGSGVGGVLCGS
jgi:hypothetical protein